MPKLLPAPLPRWLAFSGVQSDLFGLILIPREAVTDYLERATVTCPAKPH